MQFTDLQLDARLLRAVEKAGYTKMTPVQEEAIPVGLAGGDIIGTAQTGTGKTAAFVLPILHHLLTVPGRRGFTRALIVTPTRELAEQVHDVVKQFSQYTKIRSATVYGGVGMFPQERALRKGAEIIVACPGRMIDHMNRGNADLRHVECVVLDEADRMLDMGFLPQIRQLVDQTPATRQTMLFSATFAPELNTLCRDILKDVTRVEMEIAAPAKTVSHTLCPVSNSQKTALLLELLVQKETGSVLIFTRTKHRADRVAEQIERSGYRTAVLHSARSQSQRQRAIDGFRSGHFQLLVATDIAARGIDVNAISHVINYDVPDCADTYIHRIGRTGRAELTGDALTLVTNDDRSIVRDIERVLGQRIAIEHIPGFDYDNDTPVSLPKSNYNRNKPGNFAPAKKTSSDNRRGGRNSERSRGQQSR